ncbi:MAG: peptidase domain-containing ABC transporter [Prevotellaceae bacterium]|jgi:ATP-binding cassette subfamily B protein|nr:peptidase domain-containing ABC transporter [Prevotellaceae bacterium]
MKSQKSKHNWDKIFVKQHHQSWCGLACLSMLCKYYGGNMPQEKLVTKSGTTVTGTTLLGLYQAANAIGLKAEGFEADLENLKQLKHPAILHFTLPDGLEHYVVCFGYKDGLFLMGDPAKEFTKMGEEEVLAIWKSKKLLLVQRGEQFRTDDDTSLRKKAWLKELVTPDIPVLSVVAGLGIVVAIAGISLAIFSQKLIDQILPAKEQQKLWIGMAILALLLLAKNLLSYLRTILVARQSRDFSNRIVGSFYSQVLYLPKTFFDSLKTGEITARLNDAARIQRTINYVAGVLLIDVLTVIICMVLLVGYWWPAGAAAITGGVLFAWVFLWYGKRIVAGQRKVMVSYAAAESNFFDTVQGAEVIKGNNKEEFFTRYTKEIYASFQTSAYDLAILGNRIGLKVQNIGTAAIIGVIAFSSMAVLSDHLSLGALVAVLSLAGSVIASSASLSGAYITLQEAKVAYDRLYEFVSLDREPTEEAVHTFDTIHTLNIEHIRFRFPGRPLLLKDVNLIAKRGQLTAILGEIGSGKSTLLHLISRFYEPESGVIRLDGKNCTEVPIHDWRATIGVMPQHIKLFNATLLENICLTNDKDILERCLSFCNQLHIQQYFGNLPLGPLTRVGEDGVNLSGGQRQLVGLYRALFGNSKILLLDEPTNNMDKAAVQFVWDLLEREKQNRICMLVTHNEQLATRASIVVKI